MVPCAAIELGNRRHIQVLTYCCDYICPYLTLLKVRFKYEAKILDIKKC